MFSYTYYFSFERCVFSSSAHLNFVGSLKFFLIDIQTQPNISKVFPFEFDSEVLHLLCMVQEYKNQRATPQVRKLRLSSQTHGFFQQYPEDIDLLCISFHLLHCLDCTYFYICTQLLCCLYHSFLKNYVLYKRGKLCFVWWPFLMPAQGEALTDTSGQPVGLCVGSGDFIGLDPGVTTYQLFDIEHVTSDS